MTLSNPFDCPMDKIDCPNITLMLEATDVSTAVKITRDYLTKGVFPTIIVLRRRDGRYYVRQNIVAYVVAHTLSLSTIPAQEQINEHRIRTSECGVATSGQV